MTEQDLISLREKTLSELLIEIIGQLQNLSEVITNENNITRDTIRYEEQETRECIRNN